MCEGFGVIVTKDGRYLFCEPDTDGDVSHSEILIRAGIKENADPFNRAFVRVEIPTWKIGSFRFDENDTLPGWVDEDAVKTRCNILLKRVALAWAEYEKVRDSAWAEYKKACDSARAEYKKACDSALAEYKKACDSARAEFIAIISKIDGYVGGVK